MSTHNENALPARLPDDWRNSGSQSGLLWGLPLIGATMGVRLGTAPTASTSIAWAAGPAGIVPHTRGVSG